MKCAALRSLKSIRRAQSGDKAQRAPIRRTNVAGTSVPANVRTVQLMPRTAQFEYPRTRRFVRVDGGVLDATPAENRRSA